MCRTPPVRQPTSARHAEVSTVLAASLATRSPLRFQMHTVRLERFGQRIGLGGAEAQVQVPSPAFGKLVTARKPADVAHQIAHRVDVGVESLALIAPVLLALVAGEHRSLLLE